MWAWLRLPGVVWGWLWGGGRREELGKRGRRAVKERDRKRAGVADSGGER